MNTIISLIRAALAVSVIFNCADPSMAESTLKPALPKLSAQQIAGYFVWPGEKSTNPARPVINPTTVGETGTAIIDTKARQMFENEDIYFEFDKSRLLPAAQEVLKRKAEWLRSNPAATVVIEGHCDERGTNEYNQALGKRRADSAKLFLIDLGIAADRITTVSFGEKRPVSLDHNPEAWAKNSRVHFVIENSTPQQGGE